MIKRANENIRAWKRSGAYDLGYVYGRYSEAKGRAWQYCENKRRELHGWELKVISFNTCIFTAGFAYYDIERNCTMFYYITPSYDIAVEMGE